VTIDFAAAGSSDFVSETTPAGRWLSRNAWKYGWLMSYPKGKSAVVCYRYEPWHYRYYGRELAKQIHDSGLTTREYLWSHYTQVDVKTGSPVPTESSEPSAPPTGQPATSSPEPAESTASEAPTAGSATSPAVTPVPTSAPLRPAGTWFGLDPPVAILGLVLILGSLGTLGALGLRRRPRSR